MFDDWVRRCSFLRTQSDLRTVIFARISWFFAPNEMSNSARRVTTIYQVHRDHSAKPHYFIHLEKKRFI